MAFCWYYNHFTGRSRNPTTQVLLVPYFQNPVVDKTGLIFFFLFLNCCSERIRKGKLKSCIYVVLPNLHWPKWALLQFSIASCFSLTLQLELAPWSSKAVITLPDQEIPLFQLDQLTKAAHNTLAQAAWPAQGENCVARSKKGGCDHSRAKTFTKTYIAEATNNIWSVTL